MVSENQLVKKCISSKKNKISSTKHTINLDLFPKSESVIFNPLNPTIQMAPHKTISYVTILLIFISLTFSSCSKDNDLFEDTIQSQIEEELDENGELIPSISFEAKDDEFTISGELESTVLDVLKNDSIPVEDLESYQIIAVSDALEGNLIINEDNTITYFPHPESANKAGNNGRVTDQFKYTLEVKGKGTQGKKEKEATVVVNTEYGSAEMGELKAFPGAEGYGKFTSGGRGGIVYHVTNLNNDGQGSLRYGMEQVQGPRTIVFDVSGYIDVDKPLKIREGYGNLTIAGQTAPGNGITIKGSGIWVQESNVIIRYLKVRPGKNAWNPSSLSPSHEDYEPDDGIKIQVFNGNSFENIVIDHCTVTWAHDGLIDVSARSSAPIKNVTIQNSMLAENVGKHYGVLIYNSYNVSFYRNILAFTSDRNIAISTPENTGVEMVNNLIYGTDRGTWYREGTVNDFVGNNFISGQRTRRYETFKMELSDHGADINSSKIFLEDNIDDGSDADHNVNSRAEPYVFNSQNHNTGLPVISVNEVESSLVGNAGASLFYDATDNRILNSILTGTGNLINDENIVGGYPELSFMERSSTYDSDKDGMADEWEIRTFGSLNSDASDDANGNGYTNIEEFLHYLTSF